MEIESTGQDIRRLREEVLIVPIWKAETPRDSALALLDSLTGGAIADVLATGEFDGSDNQSVFLHRTGELATRRLLLYGAGSKDGMTPAKLGQIAGAAARSVLARGAKSIAFLARGSGGPAVLAQRVVEGVIIGQLSSSLYGSDANRRELERLVVAVEGAGTADPELEQAIETGRTMGEATNLARQLGNEPSNVMTPAEMARRAQEMAEREGLKAEVLGEPELKQRGFGALLAVSSGSSEPPRFIVLDYSTDQPGGAGLETIALVGKGVTFDSGGISIKPAANMDEMKFDMCGGAAVIGAMQAIARIKPRARVLGIVPACENMPSGRSYKPGDVVRGLGGKTVEIINTDAEGRLILSDAITYAVGRGASTIVDVATLTGACVIALGEIRAAVMGTDQRLIDDLIRAGEQSGERIWQLPLDDRYGEQISSPIADIKNDGGRGAGAITAAMFLKAFAGQTPWAHLDIAGTAWINDARPFISKGATGFGVRTLTDFVIQRATADAEGS
jgi:leucyl aminopeptidase